MKKLLFPLCLSFACYSSVFGSDVKVEDGVVNPAPQKKVLLRAPSEQSIERALNYLNKLRELAGLKPFSLNDYLSKAAYNHAKYMAVNEIISHYESQNYENFTGKTWTDRALYAGYPSKYVGENLSYGQRDVHESIDWLFSAIYHRFGFLNFNYDEVGIGIYQVFYVYDMGNKELSSYCENPEDNLDSYYYSYGCADENVKVPVGILDSLLNSEPDYVLWPPPNYFDTPPAFYGEEFPDPLPDYSISGYPISISFNPRKFSKVKLESFKLYRLKNGERLEITNTRLLTHENDPNNHLSPLEFALFPLERLDWGKTYVAEAVVSLNGTERIFEWEFRTKKLNHPYYVIDTEKATVPVKSGVTYELYFKPLSPNDVIESYRYSGIWEEANFDFTDPNTIHVTLKGKVGDEVRLEVKEKDRMRTINLVISEEDEAIYPEEDKILTLERGWNLKGSSEEISLRKFDIPQVSIIWKYKNGKWCAWSPNKNTAEVVKSLEIEICDKIKPGDGFWVKATDKVQINLNGGM